MPSSPLDEQDVLEIYAAVCRENPRISAWWALVMTAERAGCEPLDVADEIHANDPDQ